MKSLADIANIIDLVVKIASSFSEVQKVIVFGSYARGEANIQSDVDVAVVHEEGVRSSLRRDFKKEFSKFYEGVIEVQFTYLSEEAYEKDNHVLNVARSVREEGVVLWSR